MISKNFKVGDLEIPAIGIGTYQLRGTTCYQSLNFAISVGYRHIDSSPIYNNEHMISVALSRVQRKSVFITSKYSQALVQHIFPYQSLMKSFYHLKIDYLDLYLFEKPFSSFLNSRELKDSRRIRAECWLKINNLKSSGKVKHVGLSNFTVEQIEELVNDTGIWPEALQNEIHPLNFDRKLKSFCDKNKIAVIAHTPLARGSNKLVGNIDIITLAKKYSVSAVQLILKWTLSKNIAVIPKSSSSEHIRSNSLVDFYVSEEDLAVIDNLQDQM